LTRSVRERHFAEANTEGRKLAFEKVKGEGPGCGKKYEKVEPRRLCLAVSKPQTRNDNGYEPITALERRKNEGGEEEEKRRKEIGG
jgi:hypothetical protein